MARKKAESSEQTTVNKSQELTVCKVRKDKEFRDLCEWIEVEIMKYDISHERLHKGAVNRLIGLTRGQERANNSRETFGNYSWELIRNTFIAHKFQILKAIQNKDFKTEEQKMAYICAIVSQYLNDMYDRMENAKKSSAKTKSLSIDSYSHNGAEYQSKTDRKNDSKNEELW